MRLQRLLDAVMGAAARRPLAVGLAAGLLALAGGLLALRLTPTAATDTLVGRSTPSYGATQRLHQNFGDDAVYVLVRQPVTETVLTSDLDRVLGMEGCISGNVPKGQTPPGGPGGPCARLARTKPVQVVFGPGTFLNEAVGQIQDQFNSQKAASTAQARQADRAAQKLALAQGKSPAQARKLGSQAQQLVYAEFLRTVYSLALKYGFTSVPNLNDPQFVSRIVFDDTKGAGVPKTRFAYIFPNKTSALIQVRMRPNLSEHARKRAIAAIRDVVRMPQWRLANGGGTYVVTGAPVVVDDLSGAISHSLVLLFVVALAVMALTLALVFRTRLRLLPLVVALAAVGLTFGALSLLGASLTMASIGVLPVLIGLGVDYAIQLQTRIQEEERSGGDVAEAVGRTARRGAPAVATAAAASAAGFLVLVLSPVPMVRGFGLLLVGGIALALGCALTLGVAVMAGAARGRRRDRLAGARAPLGPAWRGAGELLTANRPVRAGRARARAVGRGALDLARQRPGRVLVVAIAIAVAGWGLDSQTTVESDLTKLVPQNGSIADLQALQKSTGVGGEIDVLVSGASVTDPRVVRWMTGYQKDVLRHFGYSEKRGCGSADVCPAFSLPDLFSGATNLSAQQISGLLNAVPPYFSRGVISADRRSATLAFGIKLMPLDRQNQVLQEMQRRLHPPAGVQANLAGLPVIAAQANAAVSSPWRRMLTLVAGLVAVALVLFAAFRRWERALVPLVPIALATGWSALVLFALRIPLNPMSVTLGALVIAIATEFSVLLSERYRAERAAGHEPRAALDRTYRSTGAAVLASGTTAIAGFAVLVVSDIRMLRDFGFVTVVDLTVALAGVLVVLPAVLLLAEQGRLRLPIPARRPRAQRAGGAA
ncbi:MAG: efflux RND transporter permease subunit [Solirubrobacteraceae bacterium]